jgi:hypothetical protein
MLLLSKSHQNLQLLGETGGGGGGWGGGPGSPMGKRTRLGFLEFPNFLSSEEIELRGFYFGKSEAFSSTKMQRHRIF